nr:hypothetical protein [Micromonospora sp. DSM 115978]
MLSTIPDAAAAYLGREGRCTAAPARERVAWCPQPRPEPLPRRTPGKPSGPYQPPAADVDDQPFSWFVAVPRRPHPWRIALAITAMASARSIRHTPRRVTS